MKLRLTIFATLVLSMPMAPSAFALTLQDQVKQYEKRGLEGRVVNSIFR